MIKGEKTYLTSLEPENLEQLRQWRNRPELRQFFREHRIISTEMQNEWWFKIKEDPNQYNFEIHDDNGGCLIGHCGLYHIDWRTRKAEFGIYIGDDNYRGNGYGSDTLKTLLKYGFETLNLNKIWCEVYSNNKALHLYRNLGFQEEGLLKDNYFDDGRYWDSHILSLFQEDWIKGKETPKFSTQLNVLDNSVEKLFTTPKVKCSTGKCKQECDC